MIPLTLLPSNAMINMLYDTDITAIIAMVHMLYDTDITAIIDMLYDDIRVV